MNQSTRWGTADHAGIRIVAEWYRQRRNIMKKIAAVAVTSILVLGTAGVAQAAAPAPGAVGASVSQAAQPKKFKNCTAMNKVFKGGVAKKKSAKNLKTVNGKKVKANSKYKPKVSAKWYELNSSLDRDKDGIACER
jgi:hypothetical protein